MVLLYLGGLGDGLVQSSSSYLDVSLEFGVKLVRRHVLLPDWHSLHRAELQQLGSGLVHLVNVRLVLGDQLPHLLQEEATGWVCSAAVAGVSE